MFPAIGDGEIVEVTPVIVTKLRKDDIVLAKSNAGFRLHRIILADPARDIFITRGDCGQENDPALKGSQILGLAHSKEVRVGQNIVQARFRGVVGWALRCVARAQYLAGQLLGRSLASVAASGRTSIGLGVVGLLLSLATALSAQVAVDATTSGSATMNGTAATLTVAHTTTATTNRVMIVGVSINITNNNAGQVTGMTWAGTPLALLGAHNDAGGTRRVEMWWLLAPASGANNLVVTVNTGGANLGVVAGVTTFTGVDQTVPLGTFISADGATGAFSQIDVPSVVNGMVLDTLATGGNQTITPTAPQAAQWNATSGNNTNPGVRGVGSNRAGAPSVPMSQSFNGTSNWSYAGISLNPSQADIGVSTTVAPVTPGTNSVYNITVFNNGPSAAAAVKLVDTLGNGTTYVSYTASAGVSCTDVGATLTCTVGTLASNATATIALTVSTTAPGFYPNTAVVSDSGTPPDYNLGNNTYVAVAPVQTVVCATNNLTVGGTLTGVINTYYPGSATVAQGATLIPVGAATGAAATIANGTELLVIQMQNASINTSNSVAYGNGFTGQGFTAVNTSGNYEFVTATGPLSGGSIPIHGAGPGGGLIFTYTSAAWSATAGASTYQVVVVPQYSSATLSSGLVALPWNGSTGGILAMDVAGALTLGNATVAVDGMGFRGAAALTLAGINGATNTDYQFAAPAGYASGAAGADGSKGEGIAGTPAYVQNGASFLATGTAYPSGTAGQDGSMARGAPGNAGGGATDGAPTVAGRNNDNAGGGGGGNGGAGGFGGNAFGNNLSSGGEGGVGFPVTVNRFAMGGGGGGGSNNVFVTAQDSSGGAGGGIIFIRAYSMTGSATLTANGMTAYTGTSTNAGGGGGAGGTIVAVTTNGGETGLTLQANGGAGGGNQGLTPPGASFLGNRIGPGAGGGGGAIYTSSVSGSPAISLNGGTNGLTMDTTATPVPYGATSGAAGVSVTNLTPAQLTGLQSAALCTPDMTLGKSHVGNFTRGAAASYTIPVSNVSPFGSTSGVVTINDTLPFGISPTGASGLGWSCSVSGQTVSCTRSDVLAAGASYPSITLNALVSQSAPATLTNTATVSGGGEANLLNDTATDTAIVGSSADLAVTDSASPNPVATNGTITYTVVVTNNGPSAADNAILVLPPPNSTTSVSLTPPAGWSCLGGNGNNSVCTNANMPGLSSATFTYVVKVANGTANGTVITGSAMASSSVFDPIPANNTAIVNTVVGTSGPNLSVTNVASPNPVQAGNPITYTQVVTNTGSSAITNGTFTEPTPANTAFVSITPPAGWICTGFPASPCTAVTVAAGASGTFTVVYRVNVGTAAGTVISDTVTVNATNQSFGANSATATDVVATATQADVALSTNATPGTVYAGNSITYTQTITNNGPAAASGVSFTQATPVNTTFQSVLAPSGWTCTTPALGATGTITCNDNSSLANGGSADIVVVLNVPSTVPIGTITATSSVSATTSDPNSANNSTTVITGVNVICDLAVTNSGTPSPVAAGSTITYTQSITNSGPSNCSTATLSEATPNNSAFVSVAVVNSGGATWSCPNTAPIACSASSSVPPGSTATVTAIYRVNAGTAGGTIITDTVSVSTTTRDTNTANNSATVNIPVSSAAQADLSVTNVGSPNPVTAGNNITYTQVVTNAGQASAANPVLTETLPAGATAVSLSGPGTWTCVLATLKCTGPATMAANTTANFTFIVSVGSAVANGTILSQTASVSSTTPDPNSANNSATVNTLVANTADLSVTNTPSPVPVQPNNTITYTQVVTNSGPSTATSVSLTETLPPNTTAQTLTGPGGTWTCTVGTLTCTNPSFAPGSATITFTVLVNAAAPEGPVNQTATVTSSVIDPNPANNSATAADVVAFAADADLVVTNSAAPTSVAAGSNVTYTQTVTNKGPSAATTVSFTQVTPPNTNFQSITTPAGWACGTKPAVGGTGTITCTIASLAVNGTASFTLVLQVNSGTPSGTNITDTATATASNIVANLTNNTASATVVVANANSADMAIVKTATPNPVTEGTPLTYTLAVTNNGPATATNVTVMDTLPSTVTYLQSTTSLGSCSEAGGSVTCQLGTMASSGATSTATITILVIPGQPGVITNVATVTADQTDPNQANNTSTQNEIVVAPTKITLRSFSARYGTDKNGANRVVLNWRTGGESHNLGFNVYRELNGNQVRMNPSIIAGSALMMSGGLSRHAAKSYVWIDPSAPSSGTNYWLEDIDVNGTRTMHGPVSASGIQASVGATPAESRMLSQMNQAQPVESGSQESQTVESFAVNDSIAPWQIEKQYELASHPAIKINVRHEGWYRVGQPELVKAGLDPNVDPATLRLYAEAVEQPIRITGATAGQGGFGPQAAINFYGTGINTVFSGTRVYWLVSGEGRGARIQRMPASAGSNQPPSNYRDTVELRQHTIYFSALITSDGENFFGALVSPTPVDQVMGVPNFDTTSTQAARLEVSLQGILAGFSHDVAVALNGTTLGDVTFIGQAKGQMAFDIPPGVLRSWSNTVTLMSQNGDYDHSLVDYIRISYPRRYLADSNKLKFTGRAGDEITVNNFSSVPLVLDITDPNRPVELTPQVTSQDGKYKIALQVPFTTTNPVAPVHTLLAVGDDRVSSAAWVVPNHPSHWHSPQPGADIAMVTYGGFAAALAPLVRAHQAEGKISAVVRIGELYDEFNFGEHSPFVIKRFLQLALKNWKKPPTYLLLNGRASLDPRNYLGFGELDLVPTRIVPSPSLMTASDDWFSDFNGNGMPTIATGRLPVSTISEARSVIGKISTYEGQSTNGSWTSNALFVADKDDTESFTQDSQTVQSGLPASMLITDVFVDNVGVTAARGDIVNAINSGQALVNYLGHGSEEQWAGTEIFDENTVGTLTNASQLPVFLIMDCLNGFFQDASAEPLGVTLLLASNGGGVAVLSSSGLNQPAPQTSLNALVVQDAFNGNGLTLGEAIVKAKSNISDPDVRRTFVLFGDPAMKVKQPASAAVVH